MTRFVAVFVAVGVWTASASEARAQAGLPGGGMITWEKFYIQQDGRLVEPPDPEARRQYLNLAHCICAKDNAGPETEFEYELKLSTTTGKGPPGDVWVGTMCNDNAVRSMNCRQLTTKTIPNIDLLTTPDRLRLNLYDVIAGKDTNANCKPEETSKFAWILVDHDSDGTYDYSSSKAVGESGMEKNIDTKPPALPLNLTASGSEDSIEITWDLPEGQEDEYAYFQALCSLADDSLVPDLNSGLNPRYQTSDMLCSKAGSFMLTETALEAPDEEEVSSAPAKFSALDQTFLCGEASGPVTSLRIGKLKNGTKYKIALLAVDLYGNVSGTYFNQTVTPRPVIDFWEDLQDRSDGAIDGGCLLSTTYGDGNPLTRTLREFRDDTLARSAAGRWLADAYYATLGKLHVESLAARIAAGIALLPLVALALLWHLLGLPVLLALVALALLWRRRAALSRSRRLRLAAVTAATVLVLGLVPGIAAADEFAPYWEDPGQEQAAVEGTAEVKWQAGIRVGPYIPDIDLQLSQNAITGKGPYEAMFGDYYVGGERHKKRVWQVLPMLDVDRIVWRGFGQIGVGGSIGYMQKTAFAYADNTSENDPMRERSTGAKNTFRLFPLAATVTYRFTYADDRWGIPVVPYIRAGLSYYMWWIKGPGGTSKVCEDGEGEMCSDDKAYGGTPGVQASAGIAIRAERIDADAARSMRNSGLQHAGFYGEVFWGRVDGFGSDTKLWVGDTTWFAGANFEF